MKTIIILFSFILLNLGAYAQSTNHGRVVKTETTKQDNATIEMTWYEDGYLKMTSSVKCTSCHGSGNCWSCGGSGRGMMGFNCAMCFGSGKCSYCHGAGALFNTSGSYPNNNGGGNFDGGPSNNNRGNSTSGSSSSICKYCGGGGGCKSCNGTGHKYNSYSHHEDTCPSCNGSGRCFNCRGTGRQR